MNTLGPAGNHAGLYAACNIVVYLMMLDQLDYGELNVFGGDKFVINVLFQRISSLVAF